MQGMSGTPIIQNGKLIGAITHVIVDNPQKGYAVLRKPCLNPQNKKYESRAEKKSAWLYFC